MDIIETKYQKPEYMTATDLQREIKRLSDLGDDLTADDAYRLRECKDCLRCIRAAQRL